MDDSYTILTHKIEIQEKVSKLFQFAINGDFKLLAFFRISNEVPVLE